MLNCWAMRTSGTSAFDGTAASRPATNIGNAIGRMAGSSCGGSSGGGWGLARQVGWGVYSRIGRVLP